MVTIAVLIGSFFLVFGAARNPNPENLRPIGTVARVLNAQVWADGHWYALAASNWSGADLVRFVPDDFVPGTKTQQITKGTLVVQHSDGWAILPKDPPH
jgi:hypothetical protein